MSMVGYASLSVAGFILAIGCILEEKSPGSFLVFTILAVCPVVFALIDMLDHLLVRTVDRWIARHHHKIALGEE